MKLIGKDKRDLELILFLLEKEMTYVIQGLAEREDGNEIERLREILDLREQYKNEISILEIQQERKMK